MRYEITELLTIIFYMFMKLNHLFYGVEVLEQYIGGVYELCVYMENLILWRHICLYNFIFH